MSKDTTELSRREKVGLAAIKASLGTEEGEYGAALFVEHHVEELEASYWQEHFSTDAPSAPQVLDLLVLHSHWGDEDEDGMDALDFGLPGEVSDYLLSVRFDEHGEVEEITMES